MASIRVDLVPEVKGRFDVTVPLTKLAKPTNVQVVSRPSGSVHVAVVGAQPLIVPRDFCESDATVAVAEEKFDHHTGRQPRVFAVSLESEEFDFRPRVEASRNERVHVRSTAFAVIVWIRDVEEVTVAQLDTSGFWVYFSVNARMPRGYFC